VTARAEGGSALADLPGANAAGPARAPLLVLGWGNRSRGDDALGPLAVDRLRAGAGRPGVVWSGVVEFLEDQQLLPEHALDLVGRRRVLLIDASRTARAPFEICTPVAATGPCALSHALTPEALLRICRAIGEEALPSCTLLAIRGEHFDLGAPPSAAARAHLEAAVTYASGWLAMGA
jgi:hydrogenase maturation protease